MSIVRFSKAIAARIDTLDKVIALLGFLTTVATGLKVLDNATKPTTALPTTNGTPALAAVPDPNNVAGQPNQQPA